MKCKKRQAFTPAFLLMFLVLSSCAVQTDPGTNLPASPSSAESSVPATTDWKSVVKTDYSGLTAYHPLGEKYTRLTDKPMPELIPGDYGTLLPYLGEILYGDTEYQVIRKYGLRTIQGMIVTDPIYTAAYQGYYYLSGSSTGGYVPALDLSILKDELDIDNPWNNTLHAACALNGSWATEFEYSSVYFTDKVIILTRSVDTNDVDVMDYNGKLLYNSKSLSCYQDIPASSGWAFQVGYGEGYIALALSNGRSVFIDALTGRETFTDYSQASAFAGGMAAVSKNGLYGFIDKTFKLAIPTQFLRCDYFWEGLCVVYFPDSSSAIIDTDGKILKRSASYISRWDAYTYNINDGQKSLFFYGKDLKEITADDHMSTPLANGWFWYTDSSGATIFNGKETHTFAGVDGVGTVSGGYVSVFKDNGNTMQEGLMTLNGTVIVPMTDGASIWPVTSEKSGKTNIIISTYGTTSTYKILDTTGKTLVSGNGWVTYLQQYDLFEINDVLSYACVDQDGIDNFRISLLKYVPD